MFGEDKPFTSREAMLCLSVPLNMLQLEGGGDPSERLRLIPSEVLDALRPRDYSSIPEDGPWRLERHQILPPVAVIRAFGLSAAPADSQRTSHAHASSLEGPLQEFPLTAGYTALTQAATAAEVVAALDKARKRLLRYNEYYGKDLRLVYHYTASCIHAAIVEGGCVAEPLDPQIMVPWARVRE